VELRCKGEEEEVAGTAATATNIGLLLNAI